MVASYQNPQQDRAALNESRQALDRLNLRIDWLNIELLRTLEARARVIQELVRLRHALGLLAYDRQQERDMLARVLQQSRGAYSADQIEFIYESIFAASRELSEQTTSVK